MKTIERYVFGAFLSSFLLAFLVLTFVLTIGLMVQIVSYLMSGVPMSLIGEFAAVSFPETLQWTMPLALLVASILVFSRLSADSEIAAMRACGVNLLMIMKWPLVFAALCTVLGFIVNNEVVPRGHAVRRSLKTKVTVGTGLDVLEPGKVISDFPKVKIYFAAKEGDWVYDLVAMDYSNPDVERMITAKKAKVTSEGRDVALDLYDMTIDPLDEKRPTMARAERFQYLVKDALNETKYTKRDKDLRFTESLDRIRALSGEVAMVGAMASNPKRDGYLDMISRELANIRTEFSKRFVFAMASICFVLVGIPLGIKSQRKESTVGMAISLVISLVYYMGVILALGVQDMPSAHPEYVIWVPVAICFALAARLVPKNL